MFDISQKFTEEKRAEFAEYLLNIQKGIGFKVSARGWCYLLENEGVITKAGFNKVESAIERCIKSGLLPVDFMASDESRSFRGVEVPDSDTPEEFMKDQLMRVIKYSAYTYTPDWWDGEDYYIQVLVEKIDLKTLFSPVCNKYHIPIANAKGWQSIYQRAEYARRFKEAEFDGLRAVMLYCGDHDPAGRYISGRLRKNLNDVKDIVWTDGETGYDPTNLDVDRFGLNKEFIDEHGISWVDNLITGSGKNLASPSHPDYDKPYVQEYIKEYGERKVEANALVTMPDDAKSLIEKAIEVYLGPDSKNRFYAKQQKIVKQIDEYKETSGINRIVGLLE